jgi:phage shock protein C
MYCTQCGEELREQDRFCSRCGTRTPAGWTGSTPKPLMLDKRNKKVAGVCSGFARYFDMDVTLMRILWLTIAIVTGGMGFIAYLGAWIIMPSDHGLDVRVPLTAEPRST